MTYVPTADDWRKAVAEYRLREVERIDLSAYRDDPVGFAVDVLRLKMWSGMERLLRAVAEHDRVLVRAGHKVSKSCSCAVCALWWVGTRENARVLITAPTFRQVRSIIWREMRLVYPRVRPLFGVDLPRDPLTGLELKNGSLVEGLSGDKPEAVAGVSSPHLMIVIDEGSGFPDDLMETIYGNAASDAKIISPTNPTKTSGWHYQEMKNPKSVYVKIHLPSTESPNVIEDSRVIPGLATRAWIDEMRSRYGGEEIGEDGRPRCDSHPVYKVRVLGEYPDQVSNAVIGYQALSDSIERWKVAKRPPLSAHGVVIGVDVARFGDDESVLQAREGNYLHSPRAFSGLDGWELGSRVLAYADELAPTLPVSVNVDGIGVGASCVDYLRNSSRGPGLTVNDIQVGESSTDGDHSNLRSQLWFAFALFIAEGGMVPPDEDLEAELLSATYEFDERGRKKVEPKRKIKERMGRSPDRADAACLAVWQGGVADEWARALDRMKV